MMEKLKVSFVLFVIAAFSGLLIYGVNELTKDPITENIRLSEEGLYGEIFDDLVTFEKEVVEDGDISQKITAFDNDENVIGYIYKASTENNYGEITILVGIDLENNIEEVMISSSTNTINFVKLIERKYLGNFIGQSVESELTFDTKTGATYTYTSVSEMLSEIKDYHLANKEVIS